MKRNKVMRKIRNLGVSALAFILCLSSMILVNVTKVEATVQATYYVSATGSDSNPGTLSQPFATISKARRAVRTINSSMTGDIYVYVMAGDYYVNSTIDFNEGDSGTNGYNVIYKNYDAAGSARFIGGQVITGWEAYSGSIYRKNVGTDWKFNTLYENGRRAVKARYPNYVPDSNPASQGPYLLSEGVSNSNTVLQYKSGDLGALDPAGWNLTDAQVVVWSGADAAGAGYTDTTPISAINTSTRQITLQQSTKNIIGTDSRYFIQGVLQLLDQPGEFYLDTTAGYLYYWAKDGDIVNQTIIAPKVKTILSIEGSSESARVHNIQFEGLSFEDTDFTNWYRQGWVNAGDAALDTGTSAFGKQLVSNGGNPVIHPNGNWIYFYSSRTGILQCYRCRMDGSEIENLSAKEAINNGYACGGANFSADGEKEIYGASADNDVKVLLANADGTEPVVVSPSGNYCYMTDINKSGTDLAYSNNSLGYKIQTVNFATSNITSLTPNLANYNCMPRYTPNGQKIVFFNTVPEHGNENDNIYSVNIDGTGLTNLTNNDDYYSQWKLSSLDTHGASNVPSISPDGTKIAYSQLYNNIAQVYVMNLDGSNQTRLTTNQNSTTSTNDCANIKWSPDGTKIAFVSKVGNYYWQLFVMDSNGGNVVQKTDFDGCVRTYTWKPDSKEIVYQKMTWSGCEDQYYRYDNPNQIVTSDICKVTVNPDTHTYNQYDKQIEMTQHRTGVVYMENTDHLSVKSCKFVNSGYSGIFMLNYNQYNTVYGNEFKHLGYSGVYLEGRYPGEGDVLKYNTISNNSISNIGELVGHAAGVYIKNSGSNEVSYSEIFNCPKYAVAWEAYPDIPNASTYSKNNTFSYLKIHDCCQDSGYAGALYSYGSSNDAPSTTNTVQQVTIDNIYADSSVTVGNVNGVFMDSDSYGQTFTNVKITNTQNDPFRNNDSGSHTNTNVSWTGSFNDSSMDFNNIGLKSDYVYPRYLSSDSFENGTGKWTAAKGTPSTSTSVKRYGSKSYVVNDAHKVIYQKGNTAYNTIASVWFYDDASDTSNACMARVDNGTWDDSYSWRGLGVDTETSTGYYVYRVGITNTATSIPRTTGWHQLKWDYTSGSKVDMYIDNTCVASPTGITSFNGIAMGNWWNSSSGTNYFDDFSVDYNPVPNSSFESSDNNNLPTDWTDYFSGGYSVSSEMAYDGGKSLKIVDTGVYVSVGATTPNIPAMAGKYYESTVYCYASSATEHFSYFIQYFDTNGSYISADAVSSSTTGSWERLRIYAQAPAGTTSIKLMCYSYGANIGTGYFDQVTFNESVSNRSFEAENGNHQPTNWVDYFSGNGGYSVSSEMAFDGKKSLKMTDTGIYVSVGATTPNISATAGEYYESTVQCYALSSTDHFSYFMQFYDVNGAYISADVVHSTITGSWERLRIYTQAPAGTTSVKLLCYSYGANIGICYFDLVTFKEY